MNRNHMRSSLIAPPGGRRRTRARTQLSAQLSQKRIAVCEPNEPTGFASRTNSADAEHRRQLQSEINLEPIFPKMPEPKDLESESLALARRMAEEDRRLNQIELSDDELSYEECLEIGEALGDVKKENWLIRAEGEINKLDVEIYEADAQAGDNDDREHNCLVCLQQYESNDVLRRLPCGHAFHICCADHWLMQTNACPCCRKPIDVNC
jgi:Ring finger domain